MRASNGAVVAVGYIRRSKASDARTVSLDAQRAAVEAYCQAQGWTLAAVVADDGVSGGRRERLVRLADVVKRCAASSVVAFHLDRYARDASALMDMLRSWGRRGVELHAVGRGRLEVDSPSGLLSVGVEALVAEHTRLIVGEKTRHALARLRDTGRRYTRIAPYGSRWAANGGHVELEPTEQATLARAVALRDAGLTLRAIAAALAGEGRLSRAGRAFAPKVLADLVTRRPSGNNEVGPMAVVAG